MGKPLQLKNRALPFGKWTLKEQNELYIINQDAFKWFLEDNRDKTIDDYNQ